MHEQSLIKSLLKQVDAVGRKHYAAGVLEVRIQIGPLSGVEPLLLQSAFDQLAYQSNAAGARLVIEEVPLVAECVSCQQQCEVNAFVFLCPTCGGNVNVIHGDGVQLVSVTLRDCVAAEESVS